MKDHICPECSSHNTINVETACNVCCYKTIRYESRQTGSHREWTGKKDENGNDIYNYVAEYSSFRVPHLLVSNLFLDENTAPPMMPALGGMKDPNFKGDVKAFGCLLFFIIPIVFNLLLFFFPETFYAIERTFHASEEALFAGCVVLTILILVGRHYIANVQNIRTVIKNKKKEEDYLSAYDAWKKKYICMRCGAVFTGEDENKA